MTREQLLALDFTEDQVNQIMALHGQATQTLQATVTQNTAEIARLKNIETDYNNLKSQLPSEPATEQEPKDPELAKALQQIADLKQEMNRKDIAVYASSKGLSGEQAENVLKAFANDVELAKGAIDSISQIISETDKAAREAEKKELLKDTPNPDGGQGGNDEKTSAEKIASKLFSGQKQSNDILSHYVGGSTNV